MNSLDDLLSAAARVPDIQPDGLRRAGAALDTAIAEAARPQQATTPEPGRPERATRQHRGWLSGWLNGWRGSWRGRSLAGLTAVAAVAAVVIAVSISPVPHAGAPAARASVQPTVQTSGTASAKPTVPPTTKPTGKPKPTARVGFSSPASNATAAQVLDEAAVAAGGQQGWPDASYWYAESASTSTLTGKTSYSANWSDRRGNGVTADSSGPIPEQITSIPGASGQPSGSTALRAIPVSGDDVPFYGYSWSQLYALPTDNTGELESDLMTTGDIHFGPKAPGAAWTGQEDLFELITNLLSGTPASPALREALYKVAATIPGVTVKGTYTDALGRTGTALQLGPLTAVIDPSTGQYLDGMVGLLPGEVNCSTVTGMCQVTDPATGAVEPGALESGPSSGMLIAQGPATGLPTITG
jgi:hypothetical protein